MSTPVQAPMLRFIKLALNQSRRNIHQFLKRMSCRSQHPCYEGFRHQTRVLPIHQYHVTACCHPMPCKGTCWLFVCASTLHVRQL